MGNPWLDPEFAGRWRSMDKPSNAASEDQRGVVLAVLRAHAPRRLLDLGCGPGEMTRRMARQHPTADVTCVDSSDVMIERAREAMAGHPGASRFVVANVLDDWVADAGRADCVTALNVIHHLEDIEKRAVFERVATVLEPGGLFVLCDRVAIDPRLMEQTIALWNRMRRLHDHPALPASYDYETYLADNVAGGDLPGCLEDQLVWLREAGFEPVTCFWQYANRAVFGGRRA
jgi:tRNA (cmo5U34)-methyltransferase